LFFLIDSIKSQSLEEKRSRSLEDKSHESKDPRNGKIICYLSHCLGDITVTTLSQHYLLFITLSR
jgi:hypothetical protein